VEYSTVIIHVYAAACVPDIGTYTRLQYCTNIKTTNIFHKMLTYYMRLYTKF